jgi:hypothetical protein
MKIHPRTMEMWFVLFAADRRKIWNPETRRCSPALRSINQARCWAKAARAEGWKAVVIVCVADPRDAEELIR